MLQKASRLLPFSRIVLQKSPGRSFYAKSFSAIKESLPCTTSIADVHKKCSPHLAHRHAHTKPCFDWEEKRPLGVTTSEELEKRIDGIKRLAQEARLCIRDCVESVETKEFDEELQSAQMAVNAAGMAYSELLEELALTNEGVGVLNEVRRAYASVVDSLRQELKNIDKPNMT